MRTIFKTSYYQDIHLLKHGGYKFWYGLLICAILLVPLFVKDFYIGELSFIFIWAIAGLGLMILVGYTGLASLGHAAFMAIGAYTHAHLLSMGIPFPVAIILSLLLSALVGGLVALSLKEMTGIYFGIATLAFAILVGEVLVHWKSVTGGYGGKPVPRTWLFGIKLTDPTFFYYLCLVLLLLVLFLTLNILRSPSGRAFVAIRDSEVSAESMGINLAWFKVLSFSVSGAFTGLAGALYAHKLSFLAPDAFTFILSVQLLMMVVVGGLGTIHGALFGAVFIGLLPQIIGIAKDFLPHSIGEFPGLEPGIFGLILVLFILFEPAGLYGRWLKFKLYLELFPAYRKATFKKQKSYLKTERLQ